jgi:hypothetical protein
MSATPWTEEDLKGSQDHAAVCINGPGCIECRWLATLAAVRQDLAESQRLLGETLLAEETVRQERDALQIQQRYGTPFDPTGVKTSIEIQSLRTRAEAAEARAAAALENERLTREEEERATIDANGLRRRVAALTKAATLRRNALIHDNQDFVGEWIAIPRADFDRLRAALAGAP